MASKVQIANQALSRLGAERITSFTDNTIEAKAVNAVYELVAEDVMSMGPWPSNKVRATLALDITAPVFGFSASYTLPTDCLRVLRVNEDKLGSIVYQVENGHLLCDEGSVSILYLKKINEAAEYDPYLRQAIVWRLCYELAYQTMGDKSAADRMIDRADDQIMELLNISNSQNSNDFVPSDLFIDVRRRP